MSDFGKDLGLVHEAVITGRRVGATERFWSALAHHEEVFGKTVAFVLSLMSMIFRLRPDFDPDIPTRLKKLDKDSPAKGGDFTPELETIIKEGDSSYIGEKELTRRIEGREDLAGQRHLEAMLRDQDAIPVEWRKYELVAPATVWSTEKEDHVMATLQFRDNKWQMFFYFCCNDFGGRFRLIRIKK